MKIKQDLEAFFREGNRNKIGIVFFNPCFHSVFLYRCSSFFYRNHLNIIGKIIWYLNRLLFHVDIDGRANLAGGFELVHGLGVVIGQDVTSMGRIRIYQGVTLGGNNGKTRIDENGKVFGQPLLEDNVIIYTGASVFGPVIIRKNSIVKAGSLITKSM